MGNKFNNVGKNFLFKVPTNPNSWAKIFDYTGPEALPKDFVMVRKDLLDPTKQGVITKELVNAQTFYSAEMDALITPMDSLPAQIEFTGLLNHRTLEKQRGSLSPDFAFSTIRNYPPEISLAVTLDGKVSTLKATATDDNKVTKVEFFVDWIKVATVTSPPYEVTVDLSNLADPVNMPSRKYAYLYARAFDGTSQLNYGKKSGAINGAYKQRAYSNIVVIGPEVLVSPPSLTLRRVAPTSDKIEIPLGVTTTKTFTVGADHIEGLLSRVDWFVDGSLKKSASISGTSAQDSLSFPFALASPTSFSTVEAKVFDTKGALRSLSWTVVPPPSLNSISITPFLTNVRPGRIQQFTASGLDQFNNPITIPSLVWSATGGTIGQTGLFAAGPAEGAFTITATSGAVLGTGSVTISIDLVGHWKFDEGSGTIAADSSGNGNDGTLKNGPVWIRNGKIGGALSFDGVNDFVDLGPMNIIAGGSGNDGLTISIWFNADSMSGCGPRLISKAITSTSQSAHWWMVSFCNNLLRFRLKTDGSTATFIANSGTLQTSVWTHAAVTYDGKTVKIYKDGLEVGSAGKSGTISTSDSVQANIGRNPEGSNHYNGSLDEVRIYNRALSHSEIQDLFNIDAPPPLPLPPPVSTPSISSLDRLYVFIDRVEKITLTGSNLTGDFTVDFLKAGISKFTFSSLQGGTTTLNLDFTTKDLSSIELGEYTVQVTRTSDNQTVTHPRTFVFTRLGDMWSPTATDTSEQKRDGKIDINDVSRMHSKWGSTRAADLAEADINAGPGNVSSGTIDIYDANKLMANWTP